MSVSIPFLLSSSPATIFEMLAKDMRLLGQRKRTLLLIAHQAARASHLCRLCPTDLTEVTCPGECCTCSRFASQLRNPELRKPQSFQRIAGKLAKTLYQRATCSLLLFWSATNRPWLQKDTLSPVQGCLLHKHPWKGCLEQRTVSLLISCAETQKTHWEVSLNERTKRMDGEN